MTDKFLIKRWSSSSALAKKRYCRSRTVCCGVFGIVLIVLSCKLSLVPWHGLLFFIFRLVGTLEGRIGSVTPHPLFLFFFWAQESAGNTSENLTLGFVIPLAVHAIHSLPSHQIAVSAVDLPACDCTHWEFTSDAGSLVDRCS